MELLLNVHSVLRWLIVLAAIAGITYFGLALLRGRGDREAGRRLMLVFTGLIDAQVLLGLILLLWQAFSGVDDLGYRIGHGAVMLVAAFCAHLPGRLRAADDREAARNNLLGIVGALVLIFIGVSIIPQGWFR